MQDQLPPQAEPRPQFASLVPLPASPLPCEAGGATASEDDGPVLRFGFSYGHVHALACCAMAKHAGSSSLDYSDRYEAAWGAIVEFLYTAPGPVTALDLYRAGTRGLGRLCRDTLKERGFAHHGAARDVMAGPWTAPQVWRYWHQPPPPTPEDTATDRVALTQVMDTLTSTQSQALLALAVHGGDHQAAAAALGITTHLLGRRLLKARLAFLAAWHDHEKPPKRWRRDKPAVCRAMRSKPADNADALRTLTDIRQAFGGRTRFPGAELLPLLVAADPGRYGGWDARDVGWFLREHAIARHQLTLRSNGRAFTRWGHWLEDVTAAIEDLDPTAPGALAGLAA